MVSEIITFLNGKDFVSVLVLSRSLYNEYIHSALIFSKLCHRVCHSEGLSTKTLQNYINQLQPTTNENNTYRWVLKQLLADVGYVWDETYPYKKDDLKNVEFTIDKRNFHVIGSKNLLSSFVTIKSKKKLNQGFLHKWQFKLNCITEDIHNTYRIMIGFESVDYFPWKNQTSIDVVGYSSDSNGCALIVGSGTIVRGNKQSLIDPSILPFKNNDVIECQLDLHNKQNIEPNILSENERGTRYGKRNAGSTFCGKCRFLLIRDGETRELCKWFNVADLTYAPYTPAASLNLKQQISLDYVIQ